MMLTHLKRPWCWERLTAGGEGDNRGWDGWMASPAQHEFESTLGVGDGQGGLACCSPWRHKKLGTNSEIIEDDHLDFMNASSVQSLSCVWIFATPWTAACQASLSTNCDLGWIYPKTHVHWVGDAIQPSHPVSSPSLPALNLSQHQGLFKWVSSLHQVAKVLEFQLQHQSYQWTPRADLLQNGLVGSPCSPGNSKCNQESKKSNLKTGKGHE